LTSEEAGLRVEADESEEDGDDEDDEG